MKEGFFEVLNETVLTCFVENNEDFLTSLIVATLN